MAGRRQSVTAQLTRQARRFSTAIAPTLTKIDTVAVLQKIDGVVIKINDLTQIQTAVELYVTRNAVQFQPIIFDIFDGEGYKIMQGILHPDELIVQEGSRKVCELSLGDEEDLCIAKLRHPVTTMTVYELNEISGSITVQSNTDETNGCRIVTENESFGGLMLACGCIFTKERWSLVKQDNPLASIQPQRAFFSENSIKVQWNNNCENDLRLVALSFGLCQMIRVAFPQLVHIIKEFKARRG